MDSAPKALLNNSGGWVEDLRECLNYLEILMLLDDWMRESSWWNDGQVIWKHFFVNRALKTTLMFKDFRRFAWNLIWFKQQPGIRSFCFVQQKFCYCCHVIIKQNQLRLAIQQHCLMEQNQPFPDHSAHCLMKGFLFITPTGRSEENCDIFHIF